MQSVAKKENVSAASQQFIWSPQYRDVLTHFLGAHVVNSFVQQWNRLLDKVGFYEYPYSKQAVEQSKANHFWNQIASEIVKALNQGESETIKLPAKFNIDPEVLAELALDDHFSIEVTIDLGKRLLNAHKQLLPELY